MLALDGGGIRGLIPARVVESLERRTGLPACKLFDLVAGTSTGGILALGLTTPADGGAGPRYSATDLVELYRTRGPEIFQRSLAQLVMSLGGLAGPKYSAGPIEQVLRSYFGTTRLEQALTPVLVTAYDTAGAQPCFFKSYPQGARPPDAGAMWEVARATSAAPTYFPPFLLGGAEPGAPARCLVDGGVFANNPALCALADAYKLHGGEAAQYLVVSIGTGNDDLRLACAEVRRRGLLRWAVPILKVVFDGVSDTVDYVTAEMANRYFRFQEEGVEQDLDDVSPAAVRRLLAAADDLIARHDAELEEVARLIAPEPLPGGPVASRSPST